MTAWRQDIVGKCGESYREDERVDELRRLSGRDNQRRKKKHGMTSTKKVKLATLTVFYPHETHNHLWYNCISLSPEAPHLWALAFFNASRSVHRHVPFLEQVSKSTWLLSSDLSYQILASLGLHISQLTFKMGDQIRPSSTSSAIRISWVFEISGGNLVEHQLYFQRRKLNIN